jgi:hypothetical protein
MLKQVQKLITQVGASDITEITLGTSENTVITQCYVHSLGTGTYTLSAGPTASTEACFGGAILNSVSTPLSTFLAPVHNLSSVVTVRTQSFTPGDEINVIINYREFLDTDTLQSAIKLSKYSNNTSTLGNTPLLANSDSTYNYNIKSIYIIATSTTNTITLNLTSTEFATAIPLVAPFTGAFFYRVTSVPQQTLLTFGSSLSLNLSEASSTFVFISYTKVPS